MGSLESKQSKQKLPTGLEVSSGELIWEYKKTRSLASETLTGIYRRRWLYPWLSQPRRQFPHRQECRDGWPKASSLSPCPTEQNPPQRQPESDFRLEATLMNLANKSKLPMENPFFLPALALVLYNINYEKAKKSLPAQLPPPAF